MFILQLNKLSNHDANQYYEFITIKIVIGGLMNERYIKCMLINVTENNHYITIIISIQIS